MGFFSKLFGGDEKPEREPFHLDPVSEMLDEDQYWRLIAESKALSGGDQYRQEELLVAALEKLSPKEIVGFRLRTDKLLFDTYNTHLWCAGYILNSGLSDDGFEYFRLWLIDQGREVFERAKADPDSLADLKPTGDPAQDYDFELLSYVADKAFENKTGSHLFEYIDGDNFPYRAGDYPELKFDWQEDDPESMRALCPRLMEKHGEP